MKFLFGLMVGCIGSLTWGCNGVTGADDERPLDGGGAGETNTDVYTLAFKELSKNEIAASSAQLSCFDFELKLTDSLGMPVSEASLLLTITGASVTKDLGVLAESVVKTDENGSATGRYCAGKTPLKATIQAAYEGTTATSDQFSVVSAATDVQIFMEFSDLSKTKVYTADWGDDNCIDFDIWLKNQQAQPIAGEIIELEIAAESQATDIGGFVKTLIKTGEDGKASGRYCSGTAPLVGTLRARRGELVVNSAKFQVDLADVKELVYVGSSLDEAKPAVDELLDEEAEQPAADESEDQAITMHALDSGPNDCLSLRFLYKQGGSPLPEETIRFQSTPNLPKLAKLAERGDDGTFESDGTTNEKRAVFDAKTNSAGIATVPVCAGSGLGSFRVEGSYIDRTGASRKAFSPVLYVAGGLPFYTNISLTFDSENARTLRGYFNTNSNQTLETSVRLGSEGDGDPISDYPLMVVAETGKVSVDMQGLFDAKDGLAKFSLNALHMVNNYAYPVTEFDGYPNARSRCEPIEISNRASATSADFSYQQLAQNWRSTIVYATTGQEAYFDRNRNGVYDEGGDGFWDKNQNGVYDEGIDVFTTKDPNDASDQFDYDSEWFIDLPSPFVDVNENLSYDDGIDILLSDEYNAPNGKRDASTTIWKYEYYPIYMGVSFYALARSQITGVVSDYELTYTPAGSATSYLYAKHTYNDAAFWSGSSDSDRAKTGGIVSHFFAHGICGNLFPGGTDLSMTTKELSAPQYGSRAINHFFYMQPGDEMLEPARRLLVGTGDSSAKINFNAVDHKTAEDGYPVRFQTEIASCNNACTGAVQTAGVACDGASLQFQLTIQEPESAGGDTNWVVRNASYSAVKTCICATEAYFEQGSCNCPDGKEFDGIDSCDTPPAAP